MDQVIPLPSSFPWLTLQFECVGVSLHWVPRPVPAAPEELVISCWSCYLSDSVRERGEEEKEGSLQAEEKMRWEISLPLGLMALTGKCQVKSKQESYLSFKC